MHGHSTLIFRGGRDPSLRAADADRETIAERLRRSHAEGRLDVQEFQDRIDRCYQAKTLGDLDELVADLPPEESEARTSRYMRAWRIPLVPVLITVLLIAAVSGPHGHIGLWIVFPLFFLTRMWGRRRLARRSWFV